jgi:hypothetical protein
MSGDDGSIDYWHPHQTPETEEKELYKYGDIERRESDNGKDK